MFKIKLKSSNGYLLLTLYSSIRSMIETASQFSSSMSEMEVSMG